MTDTLQAVRAQARRRVCRSEQSQPTSWSRSMAAPHAPVACAGSAPCVDCNFRVGI